MNARTAIIRWSPQTEVTAIKISFGQTISYEQTTTLGAREPHLLHGGHLHGGHLHGSRLAVDSSISTAASSRSLHAQVNDDLVIEVADSILPTADDIVPTVAGELGTADAVDASPTAVASPAAVEITSEVAGEDAPSAVEAAPGGSRADILESVLSAAGARAHSLQRAATGGASGADGRCLRR